MEYTILVIDDTKKILDIVKYFLENEGYRVLTASDPHAGLEICRTQKPHVLLLDIMMPGMDGYTVCDKLKERPDTADKPHNLALFTKNSAEKSLHPTTSRPASMCLIPIGRPGE